MGQYTDPNQANLDVGGYQYTNRQDYRRNEIKGSVSQYFDLGKTGHQFKAGVGYTFGEEDLNRLTNGWGQISRITATVPYYRARYYFEQPSQIGQGRTWSIFAQDTMTVGSRLTLNLGILMNQDAYAQDLPNSGGCPVPANTTTGVGSGAAVFESDGDRCTFVKFKFGDEIQPRLGLNFNVRPGKGDKVYANWGRYYNMDQQSSGRSLAPRRIYQYEARYNAATGALISDLPRAATTGKLIDPDLKPIYNDEWLAGYATPIAGRWSVDLFYMYRNTKNFIDDVPSVYPSTGPYAAANLPCTLFEACRGQEAKRKYQAATVEVNRRFADRWSANVSYTWSQFEGNIDYDYGGGTAVFNTSSIWQDGPGTFVGDPYRYGPLRAGPAARVQGLRQLGADQQPDARRLPARAERDTVAGPRPGLAGRLGALLPRAGGLPPQPDLDELRHARLLPLQALGPGGPGPRGARLQPVQQPDAAVDGLGEVHGLQEPAGGSLHHRGARSSIPSTARPTGTRPGGGSSSRRGSTSSSTRALFAARRFSRPPGRSCLRGTGDCPGRGSRRSSPARSSVWSRPRACG